MFISTTLKIVIRKRANAEGLVPIYLNFIQNRKVSKISLRKWIPLDAWDSSNGSYVNKTVKNASELNMFLRTQLNRAHEIILDYQRKELPVSFNQFKDSFLGQKEIDFIKFCEEEIQMRINLGKFSTETIRSNSSKLNKLRRFSRTIAFHELNVEFLERYESYLKNELGNSKNTIFGALKFIRTMLNVARKKELTKIYPFKNFTISYEKDTRDRLCREEVELLQTVYDSDTLLQSQQNVLKYFLFACYTGLTWGDLESLKYSEISQKLNSFIIQKRRKKTDVGFIVPLITNARNLINLTQEEGKVFPDIISNQKANLIIKEVIKRTKIKKHVSFHVARHTFGTIALNNGIPREVVQKMLGHTSASQTDLYSKVLNTYVIDQLHKMDSNSYEEIDPKHFKPDVVSEYKKIRAQLVSFRIMSDKTETEIAELIGTNKDRYISIEKGEQTLNALELLTLKKEFGIQF